MESKSKSIGHSKSKTTSPSPPTSHSHCKSLNPKLEVAKKNTQPSAEILNKPDSSSFEPPEVQYLIHEL